jgi:hypothetical protein
MSSNCSTSHLIPDSTKGEHPKKTHKGRMAVEAAAFITRLLVE